MSFCFGYAFVSEPKVYNPVDGLSGHTGGPQVGYLGDISGLFGWCLPGARRAVCCLVCCMVVLFLTYRADTVATNCLYCAFLHYFRLELLL